MTATSLLLEGQNNDRSGSFAAQRQFKRWVASPGKRTKIWVSKTLHSLRSTFGPRRVARLFAPGSSEQFSCLPRVQESAAAEA